MEIKDCPCGSGRLFAECCEPYINGVELPPTAEALMRSRYSAYVTHAIDYIINTCHTEKGKTGIDYKSTKDWSEQSAWLGLKILSTTKGGMDDSEGTVEFEALYERNGLRDTHRETAKFRKDAGRWLYDDGTVATVTVVRAGPKIGRNDPCPCGSGKKYKHCCGARGA
ncbi:MAG: YchJ family protein [Spirochaetaceae bacterium]|jgi:SEC-C motif-containing protein|nr:YchJ family protein [Spirochaetaceae bacterium]